VQYVKIKFVDPEDKAQVFIPLIRLSKVVIVKEGRAEAFIVPRKSLSLLDQKEVRYQVLGELGYDGVIQALRNARTPQI